MELTPVQARFAQRAAAGDGAGGAGALPQCRRARRLVRARGAGAVHALAAVFERLRVDDAGGAAPERAAHGAEVEQPLFSHAMASDLRNMGQSLEVIVDTQGRHSAIVEEACPIEPNRAQ